MVLSHRVKGLKGWQEQPAREEGGASPAPGRQAWCVGFQRTCLSGWRPQHGEASGALGGPQPLCWLSSSKTLHLPEALNVLPHQTILSNQRP